MSYFKGLGFSLAFLILVIDQWTKHMVLSWFLEGNHQIAMGSFLNLILSLNKGISFGMLSAGSPQGVWALIIVACGISFLLGLWIWQSESLFSALCFGLVLGGALGNVLDRFRYGGVIDFIDFHGFGYHWYTFNIADCGIVVGTGLLLYPLFFGEQKNKK